MESRAVSSGLKRRAPACLRCHRVSSWVYLLVLCIGATHCHDWLRICAASAQEDTAKIRTLPKHLPRSEGRNVPTTANVILVSEAPHGQQTQFEVDQRKMSLVLVAMMLCLGLILRQDAIVLFAVCQFFWITGAGLILESLAIWKRVPFDMLELYGEFAVVQPLLAKSLTSGVAYVLGDIVAQTVEGHRSLNVSRCVHNGITGLILHGPLLHFWILFLEGPFSQLFSSPDGFLVVVSKVVMDQTLFSAGLNAAYALLLGILAGRPLYESMTYVRKTLPPAMLSSWRCWPFVHLVTYSPFMPIEFKVLWNDVAEVAWVAILSYIANQSAEKDRERCACPAKTMEVNA